MTNNPNSTISLPETMKAVVTRGEGGYDKLSYQSVAMPDVGPDEVLLKVLAAGVNNTDINTRLGWYSRRVETSTADSAERSDGDGSGGWAGQTPFPLIQGTDCCGEVISVGDKAHAALLGQRALVRACMRTDGFDSFNMTWMASNFNGAFAGYVAVPASEVFPISCSWSDAELATIPCAYATAETMLARAGCDAGAHILVTGASGGVGSAAIQLAKRRGAHVTAVTTTSKAKAVKAIGADEIITRDENFHEALGLHQFDIIVDNVAGEEFPVLLKQLVAGGRYVSSGAIAGPIVQLDMRDLYLKDITLIGSTAWDEPVFPHLISYIEAGEITPLLAKQFALSDIVAAQEYFSKKTYIGNVVLVPDEDAY